MFQFAQASLQHVTSVSSSLLWCGHKITPEHRTHVKAWCFARMGLMFSEKAKEDRMTGGNHH